MEAHAPIAPGQGHVIGATVALALLAAGPVSFDAPPPAPCARSGRSTLLLQTEDGAGAGLPRHDGPAGQTLLLLRSTVEGGPARAEPLPGRWRCLASVPGPRGYLLGGLLPRGGWLPLASVLYLGEDGLPPTRSAFDRGGYLALAALTSPGGRYLAFVGGRETADGLYVLDVARDEVRRLGPAPAPPPAAELQAVCAGEPLAWGGCWADGLVTLEPAVLRFTSEEVLEVSLGRDGPGGRSRERSVRLHRLGGSATAP